MLREKTYLDKLLTKSQRLDREQYWRIKLILCCKVTGERYQVVSIQIDKALEATNAVISKQCFSRLTYRDLQCSLAFFRYFNSLLTVEWNSSCENPVSHYVAKIVLLFCCFFITLFQKWKPEIVEDFYKNIKVFIAKYDMYCLTISNSIVASLGRSLFLLLKLTCCWQFMKIILQ